MLFYIIWNFFEFLFVWFFYVEIKGLILEEIVKIFDGDGVIVYIDMY